MVYVRSHGVLDRGTLRGVGMTAPNGKHWDYATYVSLVSEVRAGTVLFVIEGCSSCHMLAGGAMEPLGDRNFLFICSATSPSRLGPGGWVDILGRRR